MTSSERYTREGEEGITFNADDPCREVHIVEILAIWVDLDPAHAVDAIDGVIPLYVRSADE